MSQYKVVLHYSNGDDEQDEIFDSYEAADEYGEYVARCGAVGAEILHMSNPGDYTEDAYETPDYDVIEV